MTFGQVVDATSAGVVLLALVGAAAAFAGSRSTLVALAVLLDLLVAAGLLRLAVDPGFGRVGSAAMVLAVRRLIVGSLTGRRPRRLWPRVLRSADAGAAAHADPRERR